MLFQEASWCWERQTHSQQAELLYKENETWGFFNNCSFPLSQWTPCLCLMVLQAWLSPKFHSSGLQCQNYTTVCVNKAFSLRTGLMVSQSSRWAVKLFETTPLKGYYTPEAVCLFYYKQRFLSTKHRNAAYFWSKLTCGAVLDLSWNKT